jgi:hypothetical protein
LLFMSLAVAAIACTVESKSTRCLESIPLLAMVQAVQAGRGALGSLFPRVMPISISF